MEFAGDISTEVSFDETPVFTTYASLHTDVAGWERAEFNSHPSLPSGHYYLRVDSENTNWSIKVVEWEVK